MKRSAPPLFLAASLLIGCMAEVPADDLGANEAELFGGLTVDESCSDEQTQFLQDGYRRGLQAASTPELQACVRQLVMRDYVPCEGVDPFLTLTRTWQATLAYLPMSQFNRNPVALECTDITPWDIPHGPSLGYGHTQTEELMFSRDYLDGRLNPRANEWEVGDLAGFMWQRAMYTHGYDRDWGCAQSPAEGLQVPDIAWECVSSAAMQGRVMATDHRGRWSERATSLGIGRHRESAGDLDDAWGVATFVMGPATRIRVCTDEGGGAGAGACADHVNDTLTIRHEWLSAPQFRDPDDWSANLVPFVEVEPVVLAFADASYQGAQQVLGYGRYLASRGDLATVGDDAISSLFVPPGTSVRVCSDEGTDGRGAGTCRTYDRTARTVSLDDSISFVQVSRAVTLFREGEYFGSRQTVGTGTYRGELGELAAVGDRLTTSLIVPQGLYATLCDHEGGRCHTYSRSVPALDEDLRGTVSYVRVSVMAPRESGGVVSAPIMLESR